MAIAQATTPSPLAVESLTDASEAEWEAFVLASPDATFFHRAGWRRVIKGAYGHDCHYLMARAGGQVTGVLPLVHVRSPLFGRSLVSTGFCVYGGIAARDPDAAAALGASAAALGERLRVDYVELRSREATLPDWSTKPDLYATFRRGLSESDDENLKAIPRKKRADVRKSLKNDLKLETDAPLETFYRLYARSLRDLGTPVFSSRYARAILSEFGRDADVSVVNGPDGGPVAALMTFFFRDEVLPYYGGALPEARGLHAYDYLYWSLMCRAAERGARIFDFGRSKVGTGAYDFKTFWGFEPTPLHYQYHLVRAKEVPDINPLNPKYRAMVNVWRRLPIGVANLLGPRVARQLG